VDQILCGFVRGFVREIVREFEREFVRRFVSRVDALFSYRTDNRIAIRFVANRTLIRMGNRVRVGRSGSDHI
jgi:hypothetical protein